MFRSKKNEPMRYVYFAILVFGFSSCGEDSDKSGLADRIAQLERKIEVLEDEKVRNKQSEEAKGNKEEPKKEPKGIPSEKDIISNPKPKIEEKKPSEPKTTKPPKPANDTTYHYYVNKKVSVKIHPWKDGRRAIELFDLYGKKTFQTEDINLSYSQFNHLSFHENGGVKKIKQSFNPGASMYMYESVMEFGTTNEPSVMYKSQWPASLDEMMEAQIPWFWNKRTGQWVKQEIVIEQEVPRE